METISAFFETTLGAPFRNLRWSWGAEDPLTNRLFLRIWDDLISSSADGERVSILGPDWKTGPGSAERQRHIAAMEQGATAFGVVCTAADPDADVRKITHFDRHWVLRLGTVVEDGGRKLARIEARVPVGEIRLARDLAEIAVQEVDSTTKTVLADARLGQGCFRRDVLQRWNACCCVTGSTRLEAIRASHIKPWRLSDNRERLDPANGLPLLANLDALFDAGLISFSDAGELLVSPVLGAQERKIFNVERQKISRTLSVSTRRYLRYHREQIYWDE